MVAKAVIQLGDELQAACDALAAHDKPLAQTKLMRAQAVLQVLRHRFNEHIEAQRNCYCKVGGASRTESGSGVIDGFMEMVDRANRPRRQD